MKDLKPCPFCGGEAKLYSSPYRTFYAADCTNCGASIENEDYDEVFAQWNRRVEPTAEQMGATGAGWVSVDEKLPEEGAPVLVHGDGGDKGYAIQTQWSGEWCVAWGGIWYPTHWMPLPEPPEVPG